MKIVASILTLALYLVTGSLFAQDEIIGTWDAGERSVEIYKVDGRFIGSPIDTLGVRRDEIEILNLEYDRGKWKGKLYSVKNDRLVNVECQIKEDELHLRVKAGMIRRTLKWEWIE